MLQCLLDSAAESTMTTATTRRRLRPSSRLVHLRLSAGVSHRFARCSESTGVRSASRGGRLAGCERERARACSRRRSEAGTRRPRARQFLHSCRLAPTIVHLHLRFVTSMRLGGARRCSMHVSTDLTSIVWLRRAFLSSCMFVGCHTRHRHRCDSDERRSIGHRGGNRKDGRVTAL